MRKDGEPQKKDLEYNESKRDLLPNLGRRRFCHFGLLCPYYAFFLSTVSGTGSGPARIHRQVPSILCDNTPVGCFVSFLPVPENGGVCIRAMPNGMLVSSGRAALDE